MHLQPWADATLSIAAILLGAVVAQLLLRTAFGAAVRHMLQRRRADPSQSALSAVEAERRVRTLERLAVRVTGSAIGIVAVLMVFSEVDIDVGPAVAGLGVVGIAVGFGAQTLIRDWLAGIFVVLENQYSEGDVVRIAGVEGVVEDFSLRRTTLRDADGAVHTVPNGQIIVASNLSRGERVEADAAENGASEPADMAGGDDTAG